MILARGLSLADFAAFSYFLITANMIAAYAALGVGVASGRSFASLDVEPKKAWEEIVVLWSITFVAVFIVAFLTWLLQGLFLSENSPIQWWHLALAISAAVLGIVPAGGIYGRELFQEAFGVSVIVLLVVLAGAYFAENTGSLDIAIGTIISAFIVRSFGEASVIITKTRNLIPHSFRPGGFAAIKRVLAMLGPMAIVSLLAASGPWIIGRILLETNGQREFALFAIGLQWYGLGLFVPGIITRVLFATQVRLSKDTSIVGTSSRLKVINHGVLGTTVSSLVFAAAGTMFSSNLINLYGESYGNENAVISTYLLAAIPISAANHVGNALVANERQWTWLALTLGCIILQGFGTYYLRQLGYASGALSIGGAGLFLFLSAYISAVRNEVNE